MSRDILLKIYRQFFPFGNAAPFVDRLIKILSNDPTTTATGIEFAEYVTGLSVISRGRLDEKLYCKMAGRPNIIHSSSCIFFAFLGAFKFCDVDADGWISKTDLVGSMALVHHLMGNLFQVPSNSSKSQLEEEEGDLVNNSPALSIESRIETLFAEMDSDRDGKVDYGDFKRTVMADPDIIQGFLVYDGVI